MKTQSKRKGVQLWSALLADLTSDLYAFKQSEKELTYQGEINSAPTTIKLVFPYKIVHCHEHVWPVG